MDWFATDVDRDFYTNYYGDGIRLYISNKENSKMGYIIIKIVDFTDGILRVKDNENNIIELNNEPNIGLFTNTLYNEWEKWDTLYGHTYEEDRTDYKPWVYKTLDDLYKGTPSSNLN